MRNPNEIFRAARGKWPAVLRSDAAGETIFPLIIPFGRPSTTSDFGAIRADLAALADPAHGWDIEWDEINTRRWGIQRWPRRISFNSIESLARVLELTEELQKFREALSLARSECPKLEPWLRAKAHRIPELLPEWRELICVCVFYDSNPYPNCYARQLPIPVGTKFIEEHTAILGEMLPIVLGERFNTQGCCFEERFHLRSEPAQVRFRFLDSSLRERLHWPVMDCSIPASDLARMHWHIPRVLIVENKAVFLCLPDAPRTLAILGNGKAAALLTSCGWLQDAEIVYWGDCDEAGFAILSAIRGRFPHVRSVFMDHTTWRRWNHFVVPGKRDLGARYDHLNLEEMEALAEILASATMFEQERVPLAEAEQAIRALFPD